MCLTFTHTKNIKKHIKEYNHIFGYCANLIVSSIKVQWNYINHYDVPSRRNKS